MGRLEVESGGGHVIGIAHKHTLLVEVKSHVFEPFWLVIHVLVYECIVLQLMEG